MKKITELAEWHKLIKHKKKIMNESMETYFEGNVSRFADFSISTKHLLLDYSKNRITNETLRLLLALANKINLTEKISGLFNNTLLNTTEKRPALHTALRNRSNTPIHVNGHNIMPDIQASLDKMRVLTVEVRQQQWLGATGKPIRDIVNIGIGGSHLGPFMVANALNDFAIPTLKCHFLSNIDGNHLNSLFKQIDPETTLFIVSSKSFTTLETLTNAHTIRQWMIEKLGSFALSRHFIAVTAIPEKAIEFGIPAENIFPLWEWVGGRYSVWSAIGLPVAIMIGMDNFIEFLEGAHEMDEHFRHTELSKNMPVIMALLGVWYINFFDATSYAVIPYAHQLDYFRAYLQQLDMESNGKQVANENNMIDYATGPVIWGEQGCNGQHAFHQLLHQGQHFVPVDFIIVGESKHKLNHHHDILVASGLSQSQALMQGKTIAHAFKELIAEGYTEQDARLLAPHKSIPGNRPSNILFINKITPRSLGSLLALYEHKVFTQGIIWNINSFDQWGVELGKQLLPHILSHINDSNRNHCLDSSTLGLIEHYKKLRQKE